MARLTFILLALLLTPLIGACGGGGGGSSDPDAVSGTFAFPDPPPVEAEEDDDDGGSVTSLTRSAFDLESLVGRGAFVPGRVLIGVDPAAHVDLAALGCEVEETGCRTRRVARLDLSDVGDDRLERERATLARIAKIAARPGILFAEPDYIVRPLVTPSDPRWSEQWGHRQVRLPEAWDLTTGSDDVVVAVIDTGWKDHPDLVGRREGGYDFIASSTAAADGNGRDPDPTDEGDQANEDGTSSFHGTLVSGIIAASANNGIGVAGATWQTKIMPLRAVGIGGGRVSDLVEAVYYAARLSNASFTLPSRRADIINLSVGGPGYSTSFQNAINAARAEGVLVVASAGNGGTDDVSYPAGYDGVISVGATTTSGNRANYSNFGPTLDLLAPAGSGSSGILSTKFDDSVSPAKPIYATANGTSVATPHVTGAAALIFAVRPDLTPAQVEGVLFDSAVDLNTTGRDDLTGHGRLDARAALELAFATIPVLAVSPASLDFDRDANRLDVIATNQGEGTLSLLAAVPSDEWISTSISGTTVVVRVDRRERAAGIYSGSVRIESNGGSEVVPVRMVVPFSTDNVDVRVRARDTTTLEVVAEVTGRNDGFGFATLPAGSYRFEADADVDGDGIFGEPGDLSGISATYAHDGTTRITNVLISLAYVEGS